ncbi:MAG: LVIVD repeat-containing protein, partial [Candidatus Heimdallarchaeota archaeon]
TEAGIHTFACGPGITKIQNEVCANPFDQFNVTDVRVKGDIAICVGGSDGIFTLDVSDPNNPVLLDQHIEDAPANYRKLDVQGNFAYVADYGDGIRVYDITDPTNLIHADRGGLSYATDIALYGDMAFVADGPYGIYNYNVTDPYNIVFQSSFADIFVNVTAVDVEGAKLYVVEDDNGAIQPSFFVFDITDVDNEVQLGNQGLDALFYDVFVDGDIAYTSDTTWMLPYNISDPTTPVWTTWTTAESYGVWGFGPYALSAGGSFGVTLYDCTNIVYGFDPANVNYPDATGAMQITTYGDYTYIANSSNLLILRHFESLADTYVAGMSTATSLEIDAMPVGEIYTATLTPDQFVPPGTTVDYYMSANGGANWEAVTPGVEHVFTNIGDDLRWRAEIGGPKSASPQIYEVTIDYTYNAQPDTPTLNAIGNQKIGMFKVTWDAVNDDGVIDHYVLQMSDSATFTEILKEWTPSKAEKFVMVGKGTLSFRVQAVDDEGLASEFSFIETMSVSMSSGLLMGIIGGGAAVLILAIVIPVVLISRKKKMATR